MDAADLSLDSSDRGTRQCFKIEAFMQIDNSKYYSHILAAAKEYPYSSLSENVKIAFQKDLCLRLSWNTNAIEGNTLTLEETIDAIDYDEVRGGHTYSEYTEAKNSYKAFTQLMKFETVENPVQINLEYIRKANSLIMNSDGEFRQNQVYIGSIAEVAYLPPKPEEVPEKMQEYADELNRLSYRIKLDFLADDSDKSNAAGTKSQKYSSLSDDPDKDSEDQIFVIQNLLKQISILHIQFEMVHPFRDGNGRTGRLIMDQTLLNAGLMPAIIKDQSLYRQAFRAYEKNGETNMMEHALAAGIAAAYDVLEDNCRKLLN